jgi:hypothetical protein
MTEEQKPCCADPKMVCVECGAKLCVSLGPGECQILGHYTRFDGDTTERVYCPQCFQDLGHRLTVEAASKLRSQVD